MRVLIADGDEASLEVANRDRSRHGHAASIAASGLECVARLRREVAVQGGKP